MEAPVRLPWPKPWCIPAVLRWTHRTKRERRNLRCTTRSRRHSKSTFRTAYTCNANYTYSKLTHGRLLHYPSRRGLRRDRRRDQPVPGEPESRAIPGRHHEHLLTDWPLTIFPLAPARSWLNKSGFMGYVVGGWILSSSIKLISGMPLYFRDSTVCGVPTQFQAQCIPAFIPGVNVLTQSYSGLNVNQPLYNAAAFEPTSLLPAALTSAPVRASAMSAARHTATPISRSLRNSSLKSA